MAKTKTVKYTSRDMKNAVFDFFMSRDHKKVVSLGKMYKIRFNQW